MPAIGAVCLSLFAILTLLGVAAWVIRRLQARGWQIGTGNFVPGQSAINIIASRRLGRNSCLSIVEIGSERFLVGSGQGGVTAIGILRAEIPLP